MKRKEEEPYTKKKYITVMTIGILGFLLAFGFLFAGAILQENGASEVLYYSLGFTFFPIGIIDIIFLLNHLDGLMMYELEAKINRAVKDKLITKENIEHNIEEKLLAKKFSLLEEGYYYKKKFSFLKDYINYYSKIVVSTYLEKTIEEEFDNFDYHNFNKNNKCLILFVEKNLVNEYDLKKLSEISSNLISNEMFASSIGSTAIIVLIDKMNDKAYLVAPGRMKLNFYGLTFKYIDKHFFK